MDLFNAGLYDNNINDFGSFNFKGNSLDKSAYSKRKGIRIFNEVAPYYHSFLFDWNTPNQAVIGGRASTKSSFNALKIALKLAIDKDCSGVVVRNTFNTHLTSTFAELKKALIKLNIAHRSTVSPLRIYVGKNVVYFAGLDDVEKLKGFTDAGTPIKFLWFFEITEMNSTYELRQVKSSLARGDKPDFTTLYEWNPHFSGTHWTYDFIHDMKSKSYLVDSDGNYITDEKGEKVVINKIQHNTYLDLPEDLRKRWLGKHLLMEIELLKLSDYEMYKHIYLGVPARLAGTIYKKFDEKIHVKELNRIWYDEITIGMDYGDSSATTFEVSGWYDNYRRLHVLDEYYHSNKSGIDSGKTIDEYVEDAIDFVKELVVGNLYAERGYTIIVDSAASAFYNFLEKKIVYERTQLRMLGINSLDKVKIKRTNKKKRDRNGSTTAIQERINLTNMMFYRLGYITISPKCKNLIEAFGTAIYDDKSGVRKDNGEFKVDPLDAFEYTFLIKSLFVKVKNALMQLGGV